MLYSKLFIKKKKSKAGRNNRRAGRRLPTTALDEQTTIKKPINIKELKFKLMSNNYLCLGLHELSIL
jgi:hypothetical protein